MSNSKIFIQYSVKTEKKEWLIYGKKVELEREGHGIRVIVKHSSFYAACFFKYFETELELKIRAKRLIYLIENFDSQAPVHLHYKWEKEFVIDLFKAIHLKTRESASLRNNPFSELLRPSLAEIFGDYPLEENNA